MSWQTYVDNNLVGTGKIHQAAILGLQGGVWATSSGFTISPEEQTQIINSLKTPGQAQSNGVRVSGKKYFALKVEEDRIYGKQSADSIVIVKTNQAVLVAAIIAPYQLAEVAPIVEALGDYLRGVGF